MMKEVFKGIYSSSSKEALVDMLYDTISSNQVKFETIEQEIQTKIDSTRNFTEKVAYRECLDVIKKQRDKR